MLNFLKKISELRSAVLLALILPFPFVIWNFTNIFTSIPDFPFPKFSVHFSAPGMMAVEMERKVISPAEKSFNGLQGLLLQESLVSHEKGTINLEFQNNMEKDKALLFIQEKLDRLKVSLPSQVEHIKVEPRKRNKRADLHITLPKGTYLYQWNNLLKKLGGQITQSEPYYSHDQYLSINLDVKKMAGLGLSVSQIDKALKISGLTYRLGKKKGVSYLLKGHYSNLADIKNILVGKKGHRPLRLGSVADIELKLPKAPHKIKLWIDKQLYQIDDIKKKINKEIKGVSITKPLNEDLKVFLVPTLLVGIGLLFIQIFTFYISFKSIYAVASVFVFDVIWFIDYLFMNWVLRGEIHHFDIASLYMGNMVGIFLWFFLLQRIRIYFLKSHLENFTQREIQQAVFFSLVEYIPSFGFIYALLGVISLPVLMGSINFISRDILINILFSGPLAIFLIIVMAIFSPLNWIKHQDKVRTSLLPNYLRKPVSPLFIIPFLAMGLLTPLLWNNLPLGLSQGNALDEWRGHGAKLNYYVSKKDFNHLKMINLKETTYGPILKWDITTTGLSFISGLDPMGFQSSLQDIVQEKNVLVYKENESDSTDNEIAVRYSNPLTHSRALGELMLSPNNPNSTRIPMPLRIFTSPNYTLMEKSIFRGRLNRQTKIQFKDSLTKKNLFYKPESSNIYSTSKTRFFFKEYQNFLRNHWTVILFLFVILSMYINSFYRGLLLTLMGISLWKIHEGLGFIIGSTFNIDSLWCAPFNLWFSLSLVLLISKIADIERMRGNDKISVLKDTSEKLSFGLWMATFLFMGSFVWWWIVHNHLYPTSYFSYSHELLGLGLTLILSTATVFFIFFRLYYVTAQDYIEEVFLRATLFYYRKKFG